jgi:hypothetical protein
MVADASDDEAGTTIAIGAVCLALVLGGIAIAIQPTADTDAQTTSEPTTVQADDPDESDDQASAVPVHWEGHLANTACVETIAGECEGVRAGTVDERQEIPVQGNLTDGDLTMTWDAQTPDTRELAITLETRSREDCGDGCFSWTYGIHARAEGTSPVTLTVDEIDLEEDATMELVVEPAPGGSDTSTVHAHTSQDFEVHGQLAFADP